MRLSNSQFVPLMFWVGFVALGLATGLGGKQASHEKIVQASHPQTIAASGDRPVTEAAARAD